MCNFGQWDIFSIIVSDVFDDKLSNLFIYIIYKHTRMNKKIHAVYFKMQYCIIGKIGNKSKMENIVFEVPLEDNRQVTVSIFPNKRRVESFYTSSISDELFNALECKAFDKKNYVVNEGCITDGFAKDEETNQKEVSQEICQELLDIQSSIRQSTRRVIHLLKYCLNHSTIDEMLIGSGSTYWSYDKSEWQKIELMPVVNAYPVFTTPLNEHTVQYIQERIFDGFEPLIALKYLHRALEERSPTNKWIDASIAAELAIKEFLIRKEPTLEQLLLEVPSPPLSKLYGSILEEYAGEKSPKKKAITQGIEIRNKLVHRPNIINISEEDAWCYVSDVQIAIFHLLHLLYPDDKYLESLSSLRYKFAKENK